MIKIFTSKNFESEVLSANVPVLVDFWADWCGPCKATAPIVEQLANEYGDKVKIGKLNVDENNDISEKYDIRSIPTLLIFRDGMAIDLIVGSHSKKYIKEKLDAQI